MGSNVRDFWPCNQVVSLDLKVETNTRHDRNFMGGCSIWSGRDSYGATTIRLEIESRYSK